MTSFLGLVRRGSAGITWGNERESKPAKSPRYATVGKFSSRNPFAAARETKWPSLAMDR